MKRRIVISDDHPLTRSGLKELLNNLEGCEVVGEAENGNYILAVVDEHQPDLLITDLTMPGLAVLDVIPQTKKSVPNVKVIVLSMHDDGEYVRQAMAAGADAYVTKDAPANEILKAIDEVCSGHQYLSDPVAKTLQARLVAFQGSVDPLIAITSREKQVLQLAADGQSSTDIAEALRISRRTAETHRANLMRKLSLHSQTDLVHFAFQHGLLSVEKK